MTKAEFIDYVIRYEAEGKNIECWENLTERQKEIVACANRDFNVAENKFGSEDSEEYSAEAKAAAEAWYDDFNR